MAAIFDGLNEKDAARERKKIKLYLLLGVVAFVALFYATPMGGAIAGIIVDQIPRKHDVELGRKAAMELGLDRNVINMSQYSARVEQQGERLVASLPASYRKDMDFTFAVVNDASVNAVALPGGKIYVNRGLLAMDGGISTAELAGVLAHEIGHVVKRHSMKALVKERILSLLIGFVSGDADGDGEREAFGEEVLGSLLKLGDRLGALAFSRANEFEADAAALEALARAGIGPEGLLSFFRRLLDLEASAGGGSRGRSMLGEWERTHPYTEARIEALQSGVQDAKAHYSKRKRFGENYRFPDGEL